MIERVQHRFENFEAEQAALLAAGCESDLEQIEHVLRLEVFQFLDRLPFDRLAQDGCRRLTDRAALAVEVRFFHSIVFIHQQLDRHLIAADRIAIRVRTSGTREMPLVIGRLEVVHDVVVVDFTQRLAQRVGSFCLGLRL